MGSRVVQDKAALKKLNDDLNAAKKLHLAGNIPEAEKRYRALLAKVPQQSDINHFLGIALQQQQRHSEAVEHIQRAVATNPTPDALINLGNSLLALGQLDEAADAYNQSLQIKPGTVDALTPIAMIHSLRGRSDAAEAAYREILRLRPDSAETCFGLANLLSSRGAEAEAVHFYEEAIRLRPVLPEAEVNLGNVLTRLGRHDEAVARFTSAIRHRPDMPEAYLNLGNTLYESGQMAGAREAFEKALALQPNYRDALNNLANWHLVHDDIETARQYCRTMLEIYPDHVTGHGTAAAVFLLNGEFEEGWQHYEWRWLKPSLPVPLRDFGRPVWRGEDISAKTILLHHEQGLGDSIQFVRYVAAVVARAGAVILEVPGNLRALYRCIPNVTLASYGDPLPAFDVQLPLMSLALALGTDIDTVPTPVPYLFADPQRVEDWRARLPQAQFRIGIVWQGKAGTAVDKGRSYALEHLAPLSRINGAKLISLQKGYGLEQLANLPDGMVVETLGPNFDEGEGAFLDTAAVMMHMDLIVTSDTSIAHLAGALGRPVWVPLKLSPDWRWLSRREDSPWYPTMRLFRQRKAGQWTDVFDRVAVSIRALMAGDKNQLLPPPAPARRKLEPFPPVPVPPLPAHMPPVAGQLTTSMATTVSDAIRQTQARHGVMRYPAHDLFVGRNLEIFGEWCEAEAEICSGLLRLGQVVVEAGSNLGSHTLALAQAVGPTGCVHAFEPQPFIHELLSWNVQANHLSHVTIHQACVGSAAGEVSVPDVDYQNPGNFGGIALSDVGGHRVPIITIDSMELPSLRLLKADVEGMELEVLQGAAETIMRCRPILYLKNDRKDRSEALIRYIQSLGYRLWWHTPMMFNPNNFRGNPSTEFARFASFNMLCIPAERESVVVGLTEITDPADRPT